MNFYVYGHYTLDTNELFYIGKGKDNRAFEGSKRRSGLWQEIVSKHGYRVEIFIQDLEEPDAFIQEMLGIRELKPLANLTSGGQGRSGSKWTEEVRIKLSGPNHYSYGKTGHMKGSKRSAEIRKKMSLLKKGKVPPNKGKKCSNLSKINMSKAKGGFPFYVYRKSDMSFVGKFLTRVDCEIMLGVKHQKISEYLSGKKGQSNCRNKCPYFFSKESL